MFKLQHPTNLLSRLFILEYMRDLDNTILYNKANGVQKQNLFYKFTNEETGEESIDINWEYCLFVSTLPELEFFLKGVLPELQVIDQERTIALEKMATDIIEEDKKTPVDINIMDLAATEISKINIPKFDF